MQQSHLPSPVIQRINQLLDRLLPPHCVHWSTVLLGVLLGSFWQPSHADTLTLRIDNIPESNGALMIQILGNEDQFKDKAPATAQLMLPAQEGSVRFETNALPAGSYSVRVLHDVDGNGELNTNLVGMPREPWGFSNNAQGNFGPPKWKDAVFELRGSAEQVIELVH